MICSFAIFTMFVIDMSVLRYTNLTLYWTAKELKKGAPLRMKLQLLKDRVMTEDQFDNKIQQEKEDYAKNMKDKR